MTDANFFIETPRLYLSYFQPSIDAQCDFLCALTHTPEVIVGNGGADRGAPSLPDREAARKNLESRVELQRTTGYGRYLMSLKPANDSEWKQKKVPFSELVRDLQYVGLISLKTRQHPKGPRVPDVGWSQLPRYWGNGYATEGARAVMEYFENEKGVKELLGYCNPDNEGSKRMFRRLGFEERGILPVIGLGQGAGADIVIEPLVWAKQGMKADLSEYGLQVMER